MLQLAPMTINSAAPLRLFGGFHRGVLEGLFDELAHSWPSATSLGDIDEAYRTMHAMMLDPHPLLTDTMSRDPQTNEVGRSAGLALGLSLLAEQVAMPIRLFEIGASGGLNLRIDQYRCDVGDWRWGPDDATVRFESDDYVGAVKALPQVPIVARRGCDVSPIDACSRDGALTLQSYVWPDQHDRLDRLRGALAIAPMHPVAIDLASADEWVVEHVAPVDGTLTVLMHSVMWQYMPHDVQQRVSTHIEACLHTASKLAPFAELAMEPVPDQLQMQLSYRLASSDQRSVVYADCGGHGPPVIVR